MPRGRPVYSIVRENMIALLAEIGPAYGYDIAKKYMQRHPKVTRRLIYYHLRKGVALGEFKVHKVVKEKGNYSWGPEAEKTYYELGEKGRATQHKKTR